jgi:hypothetical protein
MMANAYSIPYESAGNFPSSKVGIYYISKHNRSREVEIQFCDIVAKMVLHEVPQLDDDGVEMGHHLYAYKMIH